MTDFETNDEGLTENEEANFKTFYFFNENEIQNAEDIKSRLKMDPDIGCVYNREQENKGKCTLSETFKKHAFEKMIDSETFDVKRFDDVYKHLYVENFDHSGPSKLFSCRVDKGNQKDNLKVTCDNLNQMPTRGRRATSPARRNPDVPQPDVPQDELNKNVENFVKKAARLGLEMDRLKTILEDAQIDEGCKKISQCVLENIDLNSERLDVLILQSVNACKAQHNGQYDSVVCKQLVSVLNIFLELFSWMSVKSPKILLKAYHFAQSASKSVIPVMNVKKIVNFNLLIFVMLIAVIYNHSSPSNISKSRTLRSDFISDLQSQKIPDYTTSNLPGIPRRRLSDIYDVTSTQVTNDQASTRLSNMFGEYNLNNTPSQCIIGVEGDRQELMIRESFLPDMIRTSLNFAYLDRISQSIEVNEVRITSYIEGITHWQDPNNSFTADQLQQLRDLMELHPLKYYTKVQKILQGKVTNYSDVDALSNARQQFLAIENETPQNSKALVIGKKENTTQAMTIGAQNVLDMMHENEDYKSLLTSFKNDETDSYINLSNYVHEFYYQGVTGEMVTMIDQFAPAYRKFESKMIENLKSIELASMLLFYPEKLNQKDKEKAVEKMLTYGMENMSDELKKIQEQYSTLIESNRKELDTLRHYKLKGGDFFGPWISTALKHILNYGFEEELEESFSFKGQTLWPSTQRLLDGEFTCSA